MTIDEVTQYLIGIQGRVTSEVLDAIREILNLSREYSFLGQRFTFDASADLSEQVNLILIEMSDALLDEMNARTLKTVEEHDDDNDIIMYINREQYGMDAVTRMDKHASALRFALEGYLAVSFANKLSNADIIGDAIRFLSNPYGWQPMQEAFAHPEGWASEIIQTRGFHVGRGNDTDTIKAITLMIQYEVLEGYHRSQLLDFGRDPDIIGYRVVRGSTYDCEVCDELCIGIHPLDVQVLPAHPRCRCSMIPVKSTDIIF